jgi:hypothetical protein
MGPRTGQFVARYRYIEAQRAEGEDLVAEAQPAGGATEDEAVPEESPQALTDLDGRQIERRLSATGIGRRFAAKVTSQDLKEILHADNGAEAEFTTMHTFLEPVVIRETDQPDSYAIDAMVSAVDPEMKPLAYLLPFGPGTVYQIYGRVRMLGYVFSSAEKNEPLVFIVHQPAPGRTNLEFVHIKGEGTAADRKHKAVPLHEETSPE